MIRLFVILFITLPCLALYKAFGSGAIYVPSMTNIGTFVIVLWLSTTVTNPFARMICLFWTFWFVLGSISLFAQNQGMPGLNYSLDPNLPNQYYLYCIGSAILIIRITEALFIRKKNLTPAALTDENSSLAWLTLLSFPFLYAASIIIVAKTIPIFSGNDVSAAMYEVDYGPLHAFGIFISVACIAVWEKLLEPGDTFSRGSQRFVAILFLLVLLLIAAIDGRRALSIFALFGMIICAGPLLSGFRERLRIAMISALALLGYISASALRSGRDVASAFDNLWMPLSTVGVEYRDFCYAVMRLNRNQVLSSGYDWPGSTLASAIPGFFLKPFGYDKVFMMHNDSARVLMDYWDVKLGIRIGLPGELWLAYEWWGVALFSAFALLIYILCTFALSSVNFINRAILLSMLGVGATAVMGQSTVTFGLFLPAIYLAGFLWLIDFLTKRRKSRAQKTDNN